MNPLDNELAAHGATQRRGNVRFLVAAVVAACSIAWVVVTSFDQEVYFYTVAEVAERNEEIGTREFRIKGNVVPDSYRVGESSLNEHRFALEADGHVIEVAYTGVLPDTFAPDAEVIALGRLDSAGGFEAIEVVAKCPSRYEEQAPTGRS
jgi:cytochrome c-type biogenesis protein CcmE